MRKFIGLFVVVALLWVAAAPAQAVTVQEGENYLKLTDYSSFYEPDEADGTPNPVPLPPTVNGKLDWSSFDPTDLIGAELRAIFRIDTIHLVWTDPGTAYWTDVATDGSELTGLFSDLVVGAVLVTTSGFEAWLVPVAGSKDDATVAGGGGQIDVWNDTTPDFTNAAGPGAWDTTTHAGHDDFPTASDLDAGGLLDAGASLWLAADFVPQGVIPAGLTAYLGGVVRGVTPHVYFLDMSFTTLRGQASGFADVFVNNTGIIIAESVDFPDGISPCLVGM
jgi:hypothetical protein